MIKCVSFKSRWSIITQSTPLFKFSSKQNATLLFDAKQSLARCYGRQAANYSLLVSRYEDNSIHKIEFVPHDYQL